MKQIIDITRNDNILTEFLASIAIDDREYWSFRGNAVRKNMHAYFQYPAMMVPSMQGDLIRAVLKASPGTRRVFDPFAGSGTTLTEAMLNGLDYTGYDINPLAVLVCRAKQGPFFARAIRDHLAQLLRVVRNDRNERIEADFRGLGKWFKPKVSVELSRLRRAIRELPTVQIRRFFWVALAESVRLTSNSRTSTFKLHIRASEELQTRNLSPIAIFEEIAARNLQKMIEQRLELKKSDLLSSGHYKGSISVHLRDTAKRCPNDGHRLLHDLLVTSPPYGDNVSTVTYGQYSYLPLNWIDREDIEPAMDDSWLATTHEIDARSLGGSCKHALGEVERLRTLSPAFGETIDHLESQPRDRKLRATAFIRDLDRCIDPVLACLKEGDMLWTVGNRRVGDYAVPFDRILVELLTQRGAAMVARIERRIPSKRMAVRNSISSTMRSETILVLRREAII